MYDNYKQFLSSSVVVGSGLLAESRCTDCRSVHWSLSGSLKFFLNNIFVVIWNFEGKKCIFTEWLYNSSTLVGFPLGGILITHQPEWHQPSIPFFNEKSESEVDIPPLSDLIPKSMLFLMVHRANMFQLVWSVIGCKSLRGWGVAGGMCGFLYGKSLTRTIKVYNVVSLSFSFKIFYCVFKVSTTKMSKT